MPTIDTESYHITVRSSPTFRGHLEFTAQPHGAAPPAMEVALDNGQVVNRRKLTAIQVPLNRNDAMVLADLLQLVAFELPED